jgi:hypothetical protein
VKSRGHAEDSASQAGWSWLVDGDERHGYRNVQIAEKVMSTTFFHSLIVFVILLCLALLPTQSKADDPKTEVKPTSSNKPYELRVGASKVAIRFHAETGEAWIFLPSPEGKVVWTKIKDAKRLPTGNYDVVLGEANGFYAFRIDRATGTTWILEAEKEWTEIVEPK